MLYKLQLPRDIARRLIAFLILANVIGTANDSTKQPTWVFFSIEIVAPIYMLHCNGLLVYNTNRFVRFERQGLLAQNINQVPCEEVLRGVEALGNC